MCAATLVVGSNNVLSKNAITVECNNTCVLCGVKSSKEGSGVNRVVVGWLVDCSTRFAQGISFLSPFPPMCWFPVTAWEDTSRNILSTSVRESFTLRLFFPRIVIRKCLVRVSYLIAFALITLQNHPTDNLSLVHWLYRELDWVALPP